MLKPSERLTDWERWMGKPHMSHYTTRGVTLNTGSGTEPRDVRWMKTRRARITVYNQSGREIKISNFWPLRRAKRLIHSITVGRYDENPLGPNFWWSCLTVIRSRKVNKKAPLGLKKWFHGGRFAAEFAKIHYFAFRKISKIVSHVSSSDGNIAKTVSSSVQKDVIKKLDTCEKALRKWYFTVRKQCMAIIFSVPLNIKRCHFKNI